jgi:integrase/recombinase XerD
MRWMPSVVRSWSGDRLSVVVGHPLVDEFLEFCRSRCRPNTIIAIAWDLKTFFTFVEKTPTRVTSADVLDFIRAQSTGGDRKVVRIDGSSGVSSRTIRRRVSSVSSFYAYLLTRADTSVTPSVAKNRDEIGINR